MKGRQERSRNEVKEKDVKIIQNKIKIKRTFVEMQFKFNKDGS